MKIDSDIKKALDNQQEYQELLFRRGYLISTKKVANINEYPFYSNWSEFKVGEYYFYIHKNQDYCILEKNNVKSVIIGHAYNPFTMQYNEKELLAEVIDSFNIGKNAFFEKISEFTGIHVIVVLGDKEELIVQDCGGIKSCYFGKIKADKYITSHVQLVADLCNLEFDSYVRKLVKTKCYNIGNRYLPGNITSYKAMKRLGPNTYLSFKDEFNIQRFFPLCDNKEYKTEKDFEQGIENIYDIMHKNIELTIQKWKRPALSLSGGTDSKTTLSVANGFYTNLKIYSFQSKESEVIDSNAAHEICNIIGVPHEIYKIQNDNKDVKDFEVLKNIIDHNVAYMMNIPDHEIRKYIWLNKNMDIDIELKSWVSEITRVFFERKYGNKMPKRLNERHFNIFQTRYLFHPILMKKGDDEYKKFMLETGLTGGINNYEHSDLIYWEVRLGSWGTNVISSLDFANKVTMPFNNRKLIQEFLAFPHDYRKSDFVHRDVIKKGNKKIYDTNISIANNYFHSNRIIIEKLYFLFRTMFFKSKIK